VLASAERILQCAVADTLTHVGQIAMLRRLAGARVSGEDYYQARIGSVRTGAGQSTPVKSSTKNRQKITRAPTTMTLVLALPSSARMRL
jgi:hypothetical protein